MEHDVPGRGVLDSVDAAVRHIREVLHIPEELHGRMCQIVRDDMKITDAALDGRDYDLQFAVVVEIHERFSILGPVNELVADFLCRDRSAEWVCATVLPVFQ